jgi:hypothetical protein
MNKFILKLIISLLLFYPVVGFAVGYVLYEYFPIHYFSLYPVIPGYFSVLGAILLFTLIYYRKNNPQKITKVYMIMRGGKFLLTIGIILFFVTIYEDFEYEFSITATGFYFFYIIIETYLFTQFERERVAKCKKD